MEKKKLTQWQIMKCKCAFEESKEALLHTVQQTNGDWLITDKIAQVHQILMENNIVGKQVLEDGFATEFGDTDEYDWIYKTKFQTPGMGEHHFLRCEGLDTVCDVFLNETHLGTSESMWLPFEKEITDLLIKDGDRENELIFYFHSHIKMLHYYEEIMPEAYKGHVPPAAMLLKSDEYGSDFAVNKGYRNIGIFGTVALVSFDKVKMEYTDINIKLGQPFQVYDKAYVGVTFEGKAFEDGRVRLQLHVREKAGDDVYSCLEEHEVTKGDFSITTSFEIKNPKLWWPRNYGSQPMYQLNVDVCMNGWKQDTISKNFGVREVRKTGNMKFECNGRHIRIFGANIAPIYGPSNVFHEESAFDLIEKASIAGMSGVRIWGPSKPYPESFYDKFDELGILVWQDFPTGGSEMPCDEKYLSLIVGQAEAMLKRLKHHPSIYMWCGGNENIYMNECIDDTSNIGYDILTHHFKELSERLDPYRIYHASCPYEGIYTNDPDFGDSHGSRALRRYCPGEPYGAFYSENIRVYPPQYKSMKRLLGEDNMWEDGYLDIKRKGRLRAMPDSWAKALVNYGEEKLGPVQDYYYADNPKDLVYKFTAAASQDIYSMFARARRGNPHHKSVENPFCQGYMIWKLNDPWPNFYTGLIDHYGECSMPYYAVKKAVAPVWIDLEVDDRIYLWGVNDTSGHFVGKVVLTAFKIDENKILKQIEVPVAILSDSARVVMNLDEFGPIQWVTGIHAALIDENGNTVFTTNAFVTRENMLPFPEAKVSLTADGDELTVRTDSFARCVELSAGEDGEEFGWMFEDNYFDLFPFEEKRVRILKRGRGSCVCAKAQYGKVTDRIQLK